MPTEKWRMALGRILNAALKPLGYYIGKTSVPKLTEGWDDIDFASLGLDITVREDVFEDDRILTRGQGEFTILADDLQKIIPPDGHKGKKVLEIGPKTGEHSRWISNSLEPSKFTIVELPMRKGEYDFLDSVNCDHEVVYIDIFQSNELKDKGPFDIIFCLGVFYHTLEHVKLLRHFRNLIADGGVLLFQTTALKEPGSFLRLTWEPERAGNYLVPTVEAMFTLLAMTGWNQIEWFRNYRPLAQAAIVTCRKSSVIPKNHSGFEFGRSSV